MTYSPHENRGFIEALVDDGRPLLKLTALALVGAGLFCVLCGTPSRSLWQALLITGLFGFGSAVGVHFPIGYTNFVYLAPAYLGTAMFALGMLLTFNGMVRPRHAPP